MEKFMDFRDKLILAPMAGVCDQPFRLLCKEQGCDILYSEMVSAKAIYYKNKNTKPLLAMDEREKPFGLHRFGDRIDEATCSLAEWYLADNECLVVELVYWCASCARRLRFRWYL